MLLLLFGLKAAFFLHERLNDFVDSKMTIEEGKVHMQVKILKIYFLIPSVDVSENVQQTNKKNPRLSFALKILF